MVPDNATSAGKKGKKKKNTVDAFFGKKKISEDDLNMSDGDFAPVKKTTKARAKKVSKSVEDDDTASGSSAKVKKERAKKVSTSTAIDSDEDVKVSKKKRGGDDTDVESDFMEVDDVDIATKSTAKSKVKKEEKEVVAKATKKAAPKKAAAAKDSKKLKQGKLDFLFKADSGISIYLL